MDIRIGWFGGLEIFENIEILFNKFLQRIPVHRAYNIHQTSTVVIGDYVPNYTFGLTFWGQTLMFQRKGHRFNAT